MKKYIVLMLIALSFSAHADYLDILFQQHSDVAEILPLIHAKEQRSVEELHKIQKRALLIYRDANAYKQILSNGLSSNDTEYRRSTSRLLIETFKMYLTFNPEIPDIVKLITTKDAFSEDEFIQLAKTCLQVYKSADDYLAFFKVILRPVINYQEFSFSIFFNNKPAIQAPRNWYEKLLIETYEDFMQKSPKPHLIDVVEFINRSQYLNIDNYLIILQEITYAAYPNAASLPLIAKIGLSSDKESIRNESLELAFHRFLEGWSKEQNGTEWIMSFFLLIKSMPRNFSEIKLLEIMDQFVYVVFYNNNVDEFLVLISSVEKNLSREIANILRELLLKIGSDSKIKTLADCEKLPPEIIRKCKSTFLMNNEINHNLPIKDIYQNLAILRENNLSNNDKYRQYQKQLDVLVIARLKDEVKAHFQEKDNPSAEDASAISIPAGSTCPVCFGKLNAEEGLILKSCQHLICKDCFKEYILSQLNEGAQELRCFDRGCLKLISSNDIAESGLSDIEALINKNRLLSKISQIPGAFFCRNEYCPDAFIPSLMDDQSQDPSLVCRTCNYAQCRKCAYSHAGMSCKKFARKVKKSKGDEKRLIRGKNLKYKPCPKCHVIIEKNEGCDHMTCKSCHYEFWWSSLKKYKKP